MLFWNGEGKKYVGETRTNFFFACSPRARYRWIVLVPQARYRWIVLVRS